MSVEVSLNNDMMIDLIERKTITEIQLNGAKIMKDITLLATNTEELLETIMQKYTELVRLKQLISKEHGVIENEAILQKIRDVECLHEIKKFGFHIELETKGRIKLTEVLSGSPQFIRCETAVQENRRKTNENNQYNPKVIGVFKMESTMMSRRFKEGTETSKGRIKGLFCSMTKSQFYSFIAYGYPAHKLSHSTDRISPDSIFQKNWFDFDSPESVPPNCIHGIKDANFAHQRAGDNKPTPYIETPLRFSRFSNNNTNDTSEDKNQKNNAVCLVLCRVLLGSVLSISTVIDSPDIYTAIEKGCDAIYSSLTEEYVLLRNAFILPEFVMCLNISTAPQQSLLSNNIPRLQIYTGRLASEVILLCTHLEKIMNGATKIDSSLLQLNSDKENDGKTGTDVTNRYGVDQDSVAFDLTRSKQALVTAVGNVIDVFTKLKLEIILRNLK